MRQTKRHSPSLTFVTSGCSSWLSASPQVTTQHSLSSPSVTDRPRRRCVASRSSSAAATAARLRAGGAGRGTGSGRCGSRPRAARPAHLLPVSGSGAAGGAGEASTTRGQADVPPPPISCSPGRRADGLECSRARSTFEYVGEMASEMKGGREGDMMD